MRVLLDTHVALWLLLEERQLSAKARDLVQEAASVYLSVVSVWELAIKRRNSAGRTDCPKLSASEFADEARDAGVDLLPLKLEHTFAVEYLPLHHGDPFDRLLVAQALHEPMRLLTADSMLARYSDTVILA